MKAKNAAAFIFIVLSINSFLYAQVAFNCDGKSYSIPYFRQDSTGRSTAELTFEKLNILSSIKNSASDIELRGYYNVVSLSSGSVIVIKGNSKRLTADACYYRLQLNKADTIPPKDYKTTRWLNRNLYYSVKSITAPYTLLQALIDNKLFSLPEVDFITDSLKKNGVKVERTRAMDPYSMKFELKVNQMYRSFNCDPFLWAANKGIKELQPEIALFQLFDNLYIKSGQNLNHLFP
jgi:hypothetical protein